MQVCLRANGHFLGEREVLPGLYVGGGVRRLTLDITASVETESASGSPGFWDPLVSLVVGDLAKSGEFWCTEMAADSGRGQMST